MSKKEKAMKIVNEEILRDKNIEKCTNKRANKIENRISKINLEYEDFAKIMDCFYRGIRKNSEQIK